MRPNAAKENVGIVVCEDENRVGVVIVVIPYCLSEGDAVDDMVNEVEFAVV